MNHSGKSVGTPVNRIDGVLKVTGQAKYAGEFTASDLAIGVVVSSTIARGKIVSIDETAARALPGVLDIFTHLNRPRVAWFDRSHQDDVAPPGSPFRPLHDDQVRWCGQPIALVVADTFEIATEAASLVQVQYEEDTNSIVDLMDNLEAAEVPGTRRMGAPPVRGDFAAAYAEAPVKLDLAYEVAPEHHNPMELQATTVIYHDDGSLTVHDKTQGPVNTHGYITSVFGLSKKKVKVETPFIGGGFGSGLRPQYPVFLATMAAIELERSVRVVLDRTQMFSFVFRAGAHQTVQIGADPTGKVLALGHESISMSSRYEQHQERIAFWSGLLYDCANFRGEEKLVALDVATPGDMRAPGAATGSVALECAMDELAEKVGVDPVQLRLANYADKDQNANKQFTSKELRACYQVAAERFGWSKRDPQPGSMREGRETIGYGMASGVWEAYAVKSSAGVRLRPDGGIEVLSASMDIGTGMYTVMAQVAADAMGVPVEQVSVRLGSSDLPEAPVAGGSWSATTVGSAVLDACNNLKEAIVKRARKSGTSPIANASVDQVVFAHGDVAMAADPSRRISLVEVAGMAGPEGIEAEGKTSPSLLTMYRYSSWAHQAVFVEARVDEELGIVRIPRIVTAVAAGKILNPKTARSQIIGGIVWGVGMALHEETKADKKLKRFMNRNLGEYHIPSNADIGEIDVIFVDEKDELISPLGAKGVGEIGIVGTAAAVANAIWHATGKRIRSLPITLDKVF